MIVIGVELNEDEQKTAAAVAVASTFGSVGLNDVFDGDGKLEALLDRCIVVIGRGIAAMRAESQSCDAEWEKYLTGIADRLRILDAHMEGVMAQAEKDQCDNSTSVNQ